ncbi:MAG: inorganic phosphate transporter [Elusimicrobiota bacterium]|jgi:PiT family inorganic phosphate transporter
METLQVLFALIVLCALLFALTNGLIDGGGLVSTVITTRSLEPLPALLLVALCQVLGILLLGQQVVKTLARDLIVFPRSASPEELLAVLLSALLGAFSWNLGMWRSGMPSSSTHALIGGLAGAALARFGTGSVHWAVFSKIFLSLGLVPLAGMLFSYILAQGVYWGGSYVPPVAGRFLRGLEISALIGTSLVHGSNDGQKAMGILMLASMALSCAVPSATVLDALPLGVWLLCGLALAVGVIFGSRRTIRTVGRRLYRVQNIESVCAETSAMFLVGISSFAGYPMSTSHVMSTSVLGAGIAAHPRGIRWSLVGDIVMAWLVTIPAAGLAAMGWVYLFKVSHVVP